MECAGQKLKSTCLGKPEQLKTEGGHGVLYSHLKEGYRGDEASYICTEKGRKKPWSPVVKKRHSLNIKKKEDHYQGSKLRNSCTEILHS